MSFIIIGILVLIAFIVMYLGLNKEEKKKNSNCKYKNFKLFYSGFSEKYSIEYADDYFGEWEECYEVPECLQGIYKTEEEAKLALDNYLDKSAKSKSIKLC